MAKICPSLCVRVPVPQLRGSHLYPDNQKSEKNTCQLPALGGEASLQCLVPWGRAETGSLFSMPSLVQDTLEDYISQLPFAIWFESWGSG